MPLIWNRCNLGLLPNKLLLWKTPTKFGPQSHTRHLLVHTWACLRKTNSTRNIMPKLNWLGSMLCFFSVSTISSKPRSYPNHLLLHIWPWLGNTNTWDIMPVVYWLGKLCFSGLLSNARSYPIYSSTFSLSFVNIALANLF